MNILEKMESRQFNPGDYVAHFKHINLSDNNDNPMKYLYQIDTIARDCDDPHKAIVVYRQLYSEGDLKEGTTWARSYKDFVSEISPYKYFDNIVSRYGCKVKVFIETDDIKGVDIISIISEYPFQFTYMLENGLKAFVYSDKFLNFEQTEMYIRRYMVENDELAENQIKTYSELFKNYSPQYRFNKVSDSYVKQCSERASALQEARLLAKLDAEWLI